MQTFKEYVKIREDMSWDQNDLARTIQQTRKKLPTTIQKGVAKPSPAIPWKLRQNKRDAVYSAMNSRTGKDLNAAADQIRDRI